MEGHPSIIIQNSKAPRVATHFRSMSDGGSSSKHRHYRSSSSSMELIMKLLHSLFSYIITHFMFILPTPIKAIDFFLSLYFRLCGLSPSTLHDGATTLHLWVPTRPRRTRPSLVILHGYGGNPLWQFLYQVGPLSRRFNLYVPDLVFFGRSFSERRERSDRFQAECVAEGLKRLGVGRYSVYGISYGGFVAYRMAEIDPNVVERVVIVSSGIKWSEQDKAEQVLKIGRKPEEILVPKNPNDLRLLVDFSMSDSNQNSLSWAPDFLLQDFINFMYNYRRKEKIELLEDLLVDQNNLPVLEQETLLIWGDEDKVFPVDLAHQLQRHLGKNSRLEIIKQAGHAANMEVPHILSNLITSFVLNTP